ncbi:dipeptidase E [Schleiferia thermophila]|nr:dipeptidase E [Schleiferia thermophila]
MLIKKVPVSSILPLMKLLLASTSKLFGQKYLEYLREEIEVFFNHTDQIVFVPYARPGAISWDDYTAIAREGFLPFRIKVKGIHELDHPFRQLSDFGGIFTGGGNTFLLLKTLYETEHFTLLREKVINGAPYMGSSAGSNVAGLSIGTTNDMPIVYPPDFAAFGFVPFNINPHYVDPDPTSRHMGETREQRILEFHHFNPQPVIGLREGSWIQVSDKLFELKGPYTARLFRRDSIPIELEPGRFDLN